MTKLYHSFVGILLKSLQKIFENSARLLKRSGQICMTVPYYKSPYLEIYNQTFTSEKWKNRCNQEMIADFNSRKKIKKLYLEAKLATNFKCNLIKKPFIFKSKKKFMKWILLSLERLGGVFWWYYEEFTQDVTDNYLEKYPAAAQDKSITLYFPYMIISGYKS